MLSVEDALATILDGAGPGQSEMVDVRQLNGRVLSAPVRAAMTQPPFDASAMDGYAVRIRDCQGPDAWLRVVGESAAGAPYTGSVGRGEAVRIFTGAIVPPNTDHVVIQEDVVRDGDRITLTQHESEARNIRRAGVDFAEGDDLAAAGAELHALHGAVFAAANLAQVAVWRRPRVALFSNGDELRPPGTTLAEGQIVDSNRIALASLIEAWGGVAIDLGCLPDTLPALTEGFAKGRSADVVVSIGGASVGDRDFVRQAFADAGGTEHFAKVAVRPGKPTWFGRLGAARVLGLPGNPASAIVTAAIFLRPLIAVLAGKSGLGGLHGKGILDASVPANGNREAYLRAILRPLPDGLPRLSPVDNQDSSLLLPFLEASVLVRRRVGAPAAEVGETAEFLRLR